MKLETLIAVLLLLAVSALRAENVHVKRLSEPSSGGSSNADGASGSRSYDAGSSRSGTSVRPVRVDSADSNYSRNASSFQSDGRTRVIRRSDNISQRQRYGSVTRNSTVIRTTGRSGHVDVVPNHYYWRHANGYRYSHYYTGRANWYGFYHGSNFYWTRYYGNHYWWFDGHYNRWTFWSDGYWWWPAPGGVTYVYVNNAYVPYEEAGVNVTPPESVAPPEDTEQPPAAPENVMQKSPDGKRMVQIVGAQAEAFLYNSSSGTPVFSKFLGKNVEKVRFLGGTSGQSLQILLDFQDGSFEQLNANGDRLSFTPATQTAASSSDALPMALPSSVPQP